MVQLKIKEQNGINYLCCPNCGRMYDDDPDTLPRSCKRCGCPMDAVKALAFSEEQAGKEHIPALTAIGDKVRGLSQQSAQVESGPQRSKAAGS